MKTNREAGPDRTKLSDGYNSIFAFKLKLVSLVVIYYQANTVFSLFQRLKDLLLILVITDC